MTYHILGCHALLTLSGTNSFLCGTPTNHRRFFLCPLLYSTKCASNDKRRKEPSEACPTLQQEKFLIGFYLFQKARKLGTKNTTSLNRGEEHYA
jgi:hypothetical protein